MKTLKLLFSSMLIAFALTSCCKDDLKLECELNNTFQLKFTNKYYDTPTTLCVIDNKIANYTVYPNQEVLVDVQVKYEKICIIQNCDTVDYFTTTPIPCVTLTYFMKSTIDNPRPRRNN